MLRAIRGLSSYHSKSTSQFAHHDVRNVFDKALRDLALNGFGELKGKRVVDLGCGQRFPFALQCAAASAQATAVDISYVKPDLLPLATWRTLRHNGLGRAAKSTVRRVVWDRSYYRALEAGAGRPLRSHRSQIAFVVADPTSAGYPLPSGAFDLVASNAVLEHVIDMPRFASEVARLLASGGFFYAIIHNYYSLSGGHNLAWAFPDDSPPSDVPPWDHLRQNRFPVDTCLNRLKPEQFRDAFAQHLQVLRFEGVGIDHDPEAPEGERFLTPEVAAELSEYPRELLLTRAWCLICRKG